MRRLGFLIALVAVLAFPLQALADHPLRGVIQNFGPNLKADCPNPEGIARDPEGNLYAASFAFQPSANICVLNRDGQVVDKIPVLHGAAPVASLLGELFEPDQGLYVVDFANGVVGNGRLLKVNPATHGVTTLATGFAAANAIAMDRDRNLFVSDSFTGKIHKVAPDGSSNQVWIYSPLLQTKGQPPFGANGVAFDRHQRFLYVANTGDSTVLRVPVNEDGSAGQIEVFAAGATLGPEALHGADGIMFDVKGNLYVCANQANEIQVLSPDGELIARYRGEDANALDFPASLVFGGHSLYITNLSLATGVNSKLSVLGVPFPGLRLTP
jgi:sugar lactone lactonase YvrE